MGAIGLRGGSRRMREISLFVTFLFFLSFFRFFASPTGRHGWPISTIYTSNDAFSRKEVPFGGRDDKFSHLPLFSPNILKFVLRPMASSNGYNSGICKDRSKMFAPKWGFSGSGNLTASSKFASDWPLLPWQPTDVFLNSKLAKTQLIKEIAPRTLHHQTGVFQGQAI